MLYTENRNDSSPSEPCFDGRILKPHHGPSYRYVDFFAGLGGFHSALMRLGHECVFACEIDEELRDVYQQNFGIRPAADIRTVSALDVPQHDLLCAGFPCQPFSLAGKKKGAACPKSGKLIDDVFRIVREHEPKYIFLENVPNVLTIADGVFWEHINTSLTQMDYRVSYRIYSPLQFGIPQQRNRLFVVASKIGAPEFVWPKPEATAVRPLSEFIVKTEGSARQLEPAKKRVLEKWNELIRHLPTLTSHTIIANELGATYPIEGLTSKSSWRQCKGAFGDELTNARSKREALELLPKYVGANGEVPLWMRQSVKHTRAIYEQNPDLFDQWKTEMRDLPNSWQKFEWRGDRTCPDVWKHTIQFRASGIRIMLPEKAPSLIAMTPTQTPIIGEKRRYISVREAASLQALDGLRVFPESNQRAFKALGNAVNAQIVHAVAKAVLI